MATPKNRLFPREKEHDRTVRSRDVASCATLVLSLKQAAHASATRRCGLLCILLMGEEFTQLCACANSDRCAFDTASGGIPWKFLIDLSSAIEANFVDPVIAGSHDHQCVYIARKLAKPAERRHKGATQPSACRAICL